MMGDQASLERSAGTPIAAEDAMMTGPDALKGGDVYKWAMDQAALIRAGRFEAVDWVNVADEIESVGKSEIRALRSNLQIVLTHMLKWDYQPERRSRSWLASINVHRVHIEEDLNDSGSLKAKLEDIVALAYKAARAEASGETNLSPKSFPAVCPYDWDAITARPFVLDQTDETA